MNNAKLLFTATLGLALVSTWVMADETVGAGRQNPARVEARAEPVRVAADVSPRRAQVEPSAALPGWASGVSQWQVREEARAAVRRGNRREADDGRF